MAVSASEKKLRNVNGISRDMQALIEDNREDFEMKEVLIDPEVSC